LKKPWLFSALDFRKSIIVRFRSHDNVLLAVLGNILHKRGGKRCRQVSASHGRRRPKLAGRWAKRREDTVSPKGFTALVFTLTLTAQNETDDGIAEVLERVRFDRETNLC